MSSYELFSNLIAEIICAILVFLLGYFISGIPKSIGNYKLKKLFGSSIFKGNFKIVYGITRKIIDDRNIGTDLKIPAYQKIYQDGRIFTMEGNYTIISDHTLQAYSYIIQELAKYTKLIDISTDEFAYIDLDNSFLTIGGPISNELTYFAMQEKTNIFFQFSGFENGAKEDWQIDVIDNSSEKISFKRTYSKDIGILMKIRNTRFRRHHFFVCAGLGSWGTSGAAWYLANNWKKLYAEFNSNEFGILLEVSVGSDTSAVRIYP